MAVVVLAVSEVVEAGCDSELDSDRRELAYRKRIVNGHRMGYWLMWSHLQP